MCLPLHGNIWTALELPLDEEEGKLLDLSLNHEVPDEFCPFEAPRFGFG